jgi:hypothetical protein
MTRLIDDKKATPATPIRALVIKLTYARHYGAVDATLEAILADYLKEKNND